MNAVQVPHGLGGYLAVAAGATLGAWLRMLLGAWLNPLHPYFAFGTWAANLLGGLLVGMLVAAFARHPEIDAAWRLFLLTGFLGALTTFSTFSSPLIRMTKVPSSLRTTESRGTVRAATADKGRPTLTSCPAATI